MTGRDPAALAAELERTRTRTLGLIDDLDEPDQYAQHSSLMSPLVWDLAHIGNYEELWLLREIDGRPAIDEQLDWLYNAFEHPRWTRPDLPILSPTEARRYLSDVRGEVLDLLGKVDLHDNDRLLHDGFVYGMVLQHEHQHCETMLATRQLMGDRAPAVPLTAKPPEIGAEMDTFRQPQRQFRQRQFRQRQFREGRFVMGTDDPWAYDNERPAHEVEVAPFLIDATPVTVADHLEFVEAGGYGDERLWHPDGWAFVQREAIDHPQFWQRDSAASWSLLRFGQIRDLQAHADEPVQHVSWYEADAYARWVGKRLPTELEWERACSANEQDVQRADLGQQSDGPRSVSMLEMIGGVWEWTASDFTAYPGFESYPYDEYSKVFFGPEYKVLRGGSWATDPIAVRSTFRNWDYPIRRQIFAGFRCAHDG